MTDYALVTDSCSDLPVALTAEVGVEVLRFPYVLDGVEHQPSLGESFAGFYGLMRDGAEPTTSRIPLGDYLACFRAHAALGREVVFLAFSSALSGSYESALLARDTVLAELPGAVIRIVDTRRASIAQGALVAAAVTRRDAGASAVELEAWALRARDRAVGHFTTESLEHLRRGGRVSDMTAAAGAMLDIRPLLGFNAEGGLAVQGVVRGRKRSLKALAERAGGAPDGSLVLVGHADAPEDAAALEAAIAETRPDLRLVRCEVGPVIGSHTGPGMLAVAYLGVG